jgi:hypothetical protein
LRKGEPFEGVSTNENDQKIGVKWRGRGGERGRERERER